jgi:hypothetical protein
MKRLKDVWPDWPDPAGRPTQLFFIGPSVTRIRKIPRPVASSNPVPVQPGPVPHPDDRLAAPSQGQASGIDDAEVQREVGRVLIEEGVPVILDFGRAGYDFLRSLVSTLAPRPTAEAPHAPDNAVPAPSVPPPSPGEKYPDQPQDLADNGSQEPFGGLKGPIIGQEPSS